MLSLALALPAMAADYDLVILNGRVMDPETMLDAVMNVGEYIIGIYRLRLHMVF